MAKYKQADRRRQISLLARRVDFCNRLRQRRTLGLRDLLQSAPELIFKSDAGSVSANFDRAFNDLGFHGVLLRAHLRFSSYRTVIRRPAPATQLGSRCSIVAQKNGPRRGVTGQWVVWEFYTDAN
jgi:hypothetical protein